MIKHIVMWTLKENHLEKTKLELLREMRNKLLSLKDKIPEIKNIEVELNGANFDRNHDIVLIAEYDNLKTLAIYANHSEHQKVVKFIREISTSRVAVDFEY